MKSNLREKSLGSIEFSEDRTLIINGRAANLKQLLSFGHPKARSDEITGGCSL